ncbi:unnamed protein product [Symbiodinium natans]|uniref:N-formylglutamate amidohydrolase n=1 Tax=Symbiodinium natans TaxID=878477 RepID=A0A812PMZ6_9DINO|nr:unnamed protein product [Symbiodinium natans]
MSVKRKNPYEDEGQLKSGESGDLHWIPAGRQFRFEDLVFWQGKESGKKFQDVAEHIDTVVLGPHASAAFPEELKPFISTSLSRRKQYDFSDVITGPVGRAWAAADSKVVFVENPHSRVVVDPNREHGIEPEAPLRQCFARLRQDRGASLAGVDQVRPVTFSGEDVLLEPTEADWPKLTAALKTSAAQGPLAYEAARDQVMELVRAARVGRPLTVIGFHDTNNWKMRADGALVVERPEKDRMPPFCNFGNQGDVVGDAIEGTTPLMPGPDLRCIARAWAEAFDQAGEQDFMKPKGFAYMEPVSFNRPYPGGHEVRDWAKRLPSCKANRNAVFQVEFARSFLLGPKAAQELREPGTSWPAVDEAHVAWIANKLKEAGDKLRAAGCPS